LGHSAKISMSPFFFRPALILFLAILLAGCSSVDSQDPALLNTATQPANSITISINPCFESGCHAELKTNEAPYKHQPYVEGRCLDCHITYHTEETQRLYTQSDIDLCYSCHLLAGLGNTHPVGEGVIDPNTNQMMTCTSTCHTSHSAPYPYLLSLPPEGELCVSCHQEFIQP
jgi:predicted CXXCH cytochrome family protein